MAIMTTTIAMKLSQTQVGMPSQLLTSKAETISMMHGPWVVRSSPLDPTDGFGRCGTAADTYGRPDLVFCQRDVAIPTDAGSRRAEVRAPDHLMRGARPPHARTRRCHGRASAMARQSG